MTITVTKGTYARLALRFGLAIKQFIDMGAGAVDPSYTGELGAILINHASNNFVSNKEA